MGVTGGRRFVKAGRLQVLPRGSASARIPFETGMTISSPARSSFVIDEEEGLALESLHAAPTAGRPMAMAGWFARSRQLAHPQEGPSRTQVEHGAEARGCLSGDPHRPPHSSPGAEGQTAEEIE